MKIMIRPYKRYTILANPSRCLDTLRLNLRYFRVGLGIHGEGRVRTDVGHLLLPHAVVQPAGPHKLFMRALFDDSALAEHDDKVWTPREPSIERKGQGYTPASTTVRSR